MLLSNYLNTMQHNIFKKKIIIHLIEEIQSDVT